MENKSYDEKIGIVATLIVKDGEDFGIGGKYPAYLVEELAEVFKKLLKYIDESGGVSW